MQYNFFVEDLPVAKMQYNFFVEDLPVATFTDQLMEKYESSQDT